MITVEDKSDVVKAALRRVNEYQAEREAMVKRIEIEGKARLEEEYRKFKYFMKRYIEETK